MLLATIMAITNDAIVAQPAELLGQPVAAPGTGKIDDRPGGGGTPS